MARVNEVSSEDVVLSYCEETSPGVLPGSPVFQGLDPNSMSDFGGDYNKVSRNPIGNGRQRGKSTVTGYSAMGTGVFDLTQTNVQSLFQGFYFADFRRKTELTASAATSSGYTVAAGGTGFKTGDIVIAKGSTIPTNNGIHIVGAGSSTTNVAVTGLTADTAAITLVRVGFQFTAGDVSITYSGTAYPTLSSTTKDFTELGVIPGEAIFIGGDTSSLRFATSNNNGFARIKNVAAHLITLDKTDFDIVTDVGASKTIQVFFGRVLKNEVKPLIKTRTYTFERQLGAPDDTSTNVQGEYISAAVASEMTIDLPEQNKLAVTMKYMARNYFVNDATTGLIAATRLLAPIEDAYNTSNDLTRLRLSAIDPVDASPINTFVVIQKMTLTIKNNLTANKGLGYAGAVSIVPGTFEVGGSLTAYFCDVAGVKAVANNSDITLFAALAKNNAGVTIDYPVIALGNGKLDVAKDKAIMIPIGMDASTGAKYDANMNFTAIMSFFDYLPMLAMTQVL